MLISSVETHMLHPNATFFRRNPHVGHANFLRRNPHEFMLISFVETRMCRRPHVNFFRRNPHLCLAKTRAEIPPDAASRIYSPPDC